MTVEPPLDRVEAGIVTPEVLGVRGNALTHGTHVVTDLLETDLHRGEPRLDPVEPPIHVPEPVAEELDELLVLPLRHAPRLRGGADVVHVETGYVAHLSPNASATPATTPFR